MQHLTWETKVPGMVLTYMIDWGLWLFSGERITAVTWDVNTESGLVINSTSFTDRVATIVLGGGTEGETGLVGCQITTSTGEVERKVVQLLIRS